MTRPDPRRDAPGDEPEVDTTGDEPTPEEVLHDARVELDAWRASFRMDPLER